MTTNSAIELDGTSRTEEYLSRMYDYVHEVFENECRSVPPEELERVSDDISNSLNFNGDTAERLYLNFKFQPHYTVDFDKCGNCYSRIKPFSDI